MNKQTSYSIESYSEDKGWCIWTTAYSCSGQQESLIDLKSLLETYRKNQPAKKFRLVKYEIID